MKALVSMNEPLGTGFRVAQVETDDAIFPVADGLKWIDCPENIAADRLWFDPIDETVKSVPDVDPVSLMSFDDLKLKQIATVTAACATAITAGFTSSALGEPHTYPSGQPDQVNLNANVVSSLLPGHERDWTTPQMCCDTKGVWAYRPHTVEQIQQAGADVTAAIHACLTKKAALQDAIEAAPDAASVEAITW